MISVAIIVALVSFAAAWVLFAQPQQAVAPALSPEETERHDYTRRLAALMALDSYPFALPEIVEQSSEKKTAFIQSALYCAASQIVRRLDTMRFENFKTLMDSLTTSPQDVRQGVRQEEFRDRFESITAVANANFEVAFGEDSMSYCNRLEASKFDG